MGILQGPGLPLGGDTGATGGAADTAGDISPYHRAEYLEGGAVMSSNGGGGGSARTAGAGMVPIGGQPPTGAEPSRIVTGGRPSSRVGPRAVGPVMPWAGALETQIENPIYSIFRQKLID